MPIASYLVYPVEGQRAALCEALGAYPDCTVLPATNADLLILVTETSGWEEERVLHQSLKQCDALQCLVLIMGEVDGEMASVMPDEFVISELAEEEGVASHARRG